MNNFAVEELIAWFKRGLLWFLVTFMITTDELKDEAYQQLFSGRVSIPGVCYGLNLIKGYQAIGQLFPQRCRIVRLDFILGYVKLLLLAGLTFIIIFSLAHFAGQHVR